MEVTRSDLNRQPIDHPDTVRIKSVKVRLLPGKTLLAVEFHLQVHSPADISIQDGFRKEARSYRQEAYVHPEFTISTGSDVTIEPSVARTRNWNLKCVDMVFFTQAPRPSSATRATALCALTPHGASPRVSTTVSVDGSRATRLCPRYVAPPDSRRKETTIVSTARKEREG